MDKNGPFQSFDDLSDAATCAPRLSALRAEMAKRGLDGFVIPHSDEHQSEYLPARAERLAWLTAFTGSAGAAVVLKDKAVVFTDQRAIATGLLTPDGRPRYTSAATGFGDSATERSSSLAAWIVN